MFFSANIAAIEITEAEVRLAVVKTGRLPALLSVHTAPITCAHEEDRFETEVAALETALEGMKQRPAAYVLCLNGMFSIVRALPIPFRGARRVAAAVQFELEPYLAFPIEELMLDFRAVAEFEGQTEVLAMGVRREYVEAQLAVLAAVGITPDAVTLDAAALTGLWTATHRRQKGLSAALHIRETGAALVLTYQGKLAYFRFLPCKAEALVESPAAVAREVQNTVRSFTAKWRGDSELDTLHVTGMDLSEEEAAALSAALDLAVECEVLLPRLKGGVKALNGGSDGKRGNRWEALAGAAAGAAGGEFSVDFLRNAHGAQGVVRGLVAHLMFTSCLALVGLICWAFYYHQGIRSNLAEMALLEAEVVRMDEEIADMESRGLGAEVDPEMFRAPTLLDLLAEIARNMPNQQAQITSIRFSPPAARSGWLTIQGTASDVGVFNLAFEKLSASPHFRFEEEAGLSTRDNKTEFTITAFPPAPEEESPDES